MEEKYEIIAKYLLKLLLESEPPINDESKVCGGVMTPPYKWRV